MILNSRRSLNTVKLWLIKHACLNMIRDPWLNTSLTPITRGSSIQSLSFWSSYTSPLFCTYGANATSLRHEHDHPSRHPYVFCSSCSTRSSTLGYFRSRSENLTGLKLCDWNACWVSGWRCFSWFPFLSRCTCAYTVLSACLSSTKSTSIGSKSELVPASATNARSRVRSSPI